MLESCSKTDLPSTDLQPGSDIKQVENGEPVRRNSDIEDATNLYFVHPISNLLTPIFARSGVTPNAVSLMGMTFGIGAGFAYFRYQDTRFAILGFVLMVAWHVMDGVDGQLARLMRSQSQLGKVLDGICDYVTFTSVYMGLALVLSRQHGVWIWGLIVVSGAFHAVQSAVYEVQRQDYNFWAQGLGSAEFAKSAAHPIPEGKQSSIQRVADQLYRTYQRVQLLAIGISAESQSKLYAAQDLHKAKMAPVRLLFREVFSPVLRRWSILSANYRTLGIFIFAFLKRPVGYFLLEIFVLTTVLVLLLYRQHSQYRVFFKRLDEIG